MIHACSRPLFAQQYQTAGEPSTTELDLGHTTGDIIQQVTAIMIGPYATATKNEEQETQQEQDAEAHEPDIIQRTTHLPQASQPAFEDPKFLEEKSWWTDPTGQQAPTKVCLALCAQSRPAVSGCTRGPLSSSDPRKLAGEVHILASWKYC